MGGAGGGVEGRVKYTWAPHGWFARVVCTARVRLWWDDVVEPGPLRTVIKNTACAPRLTELKFITDSGNSFCVHQVDFNLQKRYILVI